MRIVVILAAVLAAAAPASAKPRSLHALGPVEAAAKSDGVSTAAWRDPGGPIVVWSGGRARTVEPPAGACGLLGGPLAVGSGRLLFWCGPNELWVMDGATGATRAVTPDRNLDANARGQIPTSFAVGRSWALMRWPLEDGQVAVDVRSGHAVDANPIATHRIDLDRSQLFTRPCVPRTGARLIAQAGGYALLTGTATFDAQLVRCGHPRRGRGLIGDALQLGGGWLTWRPSRSMASVAALRLRDHRVFRFRLPQIAPGIDWYNAAVGIAHTKDRIFVTDNLTGRTVLRTAPLPR